MEQIDENNDYNNKFWLVQRHSDISVVGKGLVCRYDKYMLTEKFSSHTLFCDAFVGLDITNRAWLGKPEMEKESYENMPTADCEKIIQRGEKLRIVVSSAALLTSYIYRFRGCRPSLLEWLNHVQKS